MNKQLSEWKTQGNYFQFGNHNIFYQQSGDTHKPCLVCIHGFPTSSWDWHKLWPQLTSTYHVIALDQLGFGFSEKPNNSDYGIILQTDILEGLLKHLNVQSYHLIAHDFGTLVAQELLYRNKHDQFNQRETPKLISLFAMSGSIFPELSNPRLIQKLLISRLGFLVTIFFNQKMFNRNISRVFSNHKLTSQAEKEQLTLFNNYWQLLTYAQGNKQLHHLNFFLKDREKYGEKWANAWQQSKIPIRYVTGETDPMYGKEILERFISLSHQKDIHTIANVGHFPHIESPREVTQLLYDFLQSPLNTEHCK